MLSSVVGAFFLERPLKKRPRVIIYDVSRDIKKKQLSKAISEQNNELADGVTDLANNFRPKFRTEKKNSETTKWVVEVRPSTRKVLLNATKLFIGWRAYKIISVSTGLEIAQLNANRSRKVTSEIRNIVVEAGLDILLFQEPYYKAQSIESLSIETRIIKYEKSLHGQR